MSVQPHQVVTALGNPRGADDVGQGTPNRRGTMGGRYGQSMNLGLGVALGVSFGLLFDSLALGIVFGAAFALCFGAYGSKKNQG